MDRGGRMAPWSEESISRMCSLFWITISTFFASRTFETQTLGAETIKKRPQARFFNGWPLPPYVYLNKLWPYTGKFDQKLFKVDTLLWDYDICLQKLFTNKLTRMLNLVFLFSCCSSSFSNFLLHIIHVTVYCSHFEVLHESQILSPFSFHLSPVEYIS